VLDNVNGVAYKQENNKIGIVHVTWYGGAFA